MKSLNGLIRGAKWSVSGERDSSTNGWRGSMIETAPGAPGFFPPEVVLEVKALACELPATTGVPLSRWSTPDIARYVRSVGLVATISDKTVWRWLNEDAIRPWQHRTWIFPRDPNFAIKAGRILDLYENRWAGKPLKSDEFVISADEKTSILPIPVKSATDSGIIPAVYRSVATLVFLSCTKVADLGQEFCAFLSQSESRSCGTTFSSP